VREERLRISDAAGEPKTFSENGYREAAMTDKINGDDTPNTSSPEYQALLDDLKAYDNSEVFHDNSLPQLYKLRITTALLPDLPTLLNIEVDGNALVRALRENMFALMQRSPGSLERMQNVLGNMGWEEIRSGLIADEDYLKSEGDMFWFFVRNLPKLVVHTYNIAAFTSAVATIGRLYSKPEEIEVREKAFRAALKELLYLLEKDLKQMLETRPSGRPKKYGTGTLPDIVKRVVLKALEMMGDARGKDAVPVLKAVAFNLDLTENALRKQLVRAGHPWAGIRDWLANQP
jgi:hypothetical protein